MKTNVMSIPNGIRKGLIKNSSKILTGLGIAGMISATGLAIKATPKAIELRNEKIKELDRKALNKASEQGLVAYEGVTDISIPETIKTCWKPYIPSLSFTILSTICLIGSNRVSTGRIAALSTLYKVSETAFIDFKDAVKETVDEKKMKEINHKFDEKSVDHYPIREQNVVVVGKKGDNLCFNRLEGRYFETNENELERVINVLNRRMNNEMYISLNDFYVELGLEPSDLGGMLGWCSDNDYLELDYDAKIAVDGRPCMVIEFNIMPKYDYSKIY